MLLSFMSMACGTFDVNKALKLENVTVAADFVGNICLTASSFQY
jgi:hypothetical protein